MLLLLTGGRESGGASIGFGGYYDQGSVQMFKNVAAQKVSLFAFDTTTNVPKTGDSANVLAYISKDGGAITALTDITATEQDATNAKGWYQFDVSQTESNADDILFTGKSSTANVVLVGYRVATNPALFTTLGIDASGRVDIGKLLGTAWLTPGTAGTPDVNVKLWNALTTVALPLVPATVGRTLVVDAAGLADANVVKLGPTGAGTAQTARDIGTSVLLSSGVGTGQLSITSGIAKVDVDTIKTNPVVNAGTITFPTTATLASTTNLTAGTIAAVSGAVGSVTGAVGSVTGAVGSVTGNIGGNVVGSVASVTAAVATTSNTKNAQALANFEFLMTDSTTHAPATGKTVTVTRSIDGGAFAAGTLSAVTEIAQGIYAVNFGAGDLTGKVITLRGVATGCDDAFERIVTQP